MADWGVEEPCRNEGSVMLKRRWWLPPGIVTLLVALSSVFATAGVRDAITGAPVTDARVHLPTQYVAFSPLHRTLDLICLLSVPQHIALLISTAVVFVIWRARRRRDPASKLVRNEIVAAVTFTGAVALIYLLAIAGPRPMAAFEVTDADVVRVDFHSHTNVSGDARGSFDPAKNRRWHRAAGYDVAYVTDHRRFRGARTAVEANPRFAGQGLVALMGFEGRIGGVDVVVPGMTGADSSMIGVRQRLHLDTLASGREPVVIAAIPVRNLERIDTIAGIDSAYVRAIEIVDGAPRGLLQEQRNGDRIREIARRHNLLLVAGSNNHGWGRTAAAWNLVRIPGWRLLTPDSLGNRIEDVLRRRDPANLRVVERVRPWAGTNPGLLVATLPVAAWQILTTLTPTERIVWIAIAWAVGLAIFIANKRLHTDDNIELA